MAWPLAYGLQAQHLRGQPIQQTRPTILLVHDAFLAPSHFGDLYQELENVGERLLVPQLPSSSYAVSANTLEADVHTLIDHGKAEVDAGRDLVVVAHGYGAIPALIMAERLKQYSLDRPSAGYVCRIVLIAGVVLKAGQSWMEAVQPRWIFAQDGLVWVGEPENIFFHDCPPTARAQAAALVSAKREDSLQTPVASSGRISVPVTYVLCRRSNAIPCALQEGFIRVLQTVNRRVSVVGYQTGHCPFLSASSDFAALILRVVS